MNGGSSSLCLANICCPFLSLCLPLWLGKMASQSNLNPISLVANKVGQFLILARPFTDWSFGICSINSEVLYIFCILTSWSLEYSWYVASQAVTLFGRGGHGTFMRCSLAEKLHHWRWTLRVCGLIPTPAHSLCSVQPPSATPSLAGPPPFQKHKPNSCFLPAYLSGNTFNTSAREVEAEGASLPRPTQRNSISKNKTK